MTMPGNKYPWYIAPGQVTDDSELAMCQMHALSQMKQGQFDKYNIAMMYKMWYEDGPFDIGSTTRNGLEGLCSKEKLTPEQLFKQAIHTVQGKNFKSQSNGSLMRCTPIAVYGSRLSPKELRRAVI